MTSINSNFSNAQTVHAIAGKITQRVTRPWAVMEICGGQTHAFLRHGLDQLLPAGLELIHGPGCPVCVTPAEKIDQAVDLGLRHAAIVCSFGDMFRVPGSRQSLLDAKAQGADIRMVYSPLEAVDIARANPDREVVFFAIGFETTAPTNAMAVIQAQQLGVNNFSLLVSQVTVPAAIDSLLAGGQHRIDGFLAAGHVCVVTGYHAYHRLVDKYRLPIVVTGFEPVDLLLGLYHCVCLLEENRPRLYNAYSRYVTERGNPQTQTAMDKVFQPQDQLWRGIGVIAQSGLGLRPEYDRFNAEKKFALEKEAAVDTRRDDGCISGEIMQGLKRPDQCPLFGKSCTPEQPKGATMVSGEGACAAYFRYGRLEPQMDTDEHG